MRSPRMVVLCVAALVATTACSGGGGRRARDGWFGTDGRSRVDVNTASAAEIERLPGLSREDAERIVANRPYGSKRALVNKGVIGERKYERIEDQVRVGGPDRRKRQQDREDDD